MAAQNDSNGLLKFMTNATSSIQEAMGRSAKTKKVNHRKYLEKRIQGGPKKTKKPKTAISMYNTRQPIATLVPKQSSQSYIQTLENEYDQLFELVSPPSIFRSPKTSRNSYAPPQNNRDDYQQQQEIETILSEFEADSPLQSLYSDSTSARNSIDTTVCPSTNFSMENTLVTFNDGYVYSPSDDISDFDESNYSSPRNPSPVYHSNVSPTPPEMYQQHHNLTATYDYIPTTGTSYASIIPDRPSCLSLASYNASITDILELVSTP